MKFSAREDIEAPIDYVFRGVTDFTDFERQAMRRGAQVIRLDQGPVSVGAKWNIAFKFRGRERRLDAELTTFSEPEGYTAKGESENILVDTEVELVALSPKRTRLLLNVDLRAKNLTARLLLQSMKLAKAKLVKRFKARVLDYTEDLEERYRKGH